jgi:RNA recognition motif-containing protein
MHSRTLYVSNLPLWITDEWIAAKLGQFGLVVSIALSRHFSAGRRHRRGYVEMQTARQAQSAVRALNDAQIDDRKIQAFQAIVFECGHDDSRRERT